MSDKGYFFALEGIDGSGKSSVSDFVVAELTDLGYEVVLTREPGGTPLGVKVRDLLLNLNRKTKPCDAAELFLFLADRAQHVETSIRPAIDYGQIIITDRYSYSTFAYQGFGRDKDLEELIRLNDLATGGLKPEKVLLLDLSPEEAFKRVFYRTNAEGSGSSDRIEEEHLSFHNRVREGFLHFAKQEPDRFVTIDANAPIEEVCEKALKSIVDHIEK